MSAMNSLYFARPDTMEVWQVDEPTPGPGQVKVKTAYASICATEEKGRRWMLMVR